MTQDVIETRAAEPDGGNTRPTEEEPMTTTAPDLTTTVDLWLQAYGETDPEIRAELLARVWAPEGILADPPFTGTGPAEIAGLVAAAQAQFPGHTFRRTSEIDAHHELARYTWEMVAPDGTPALAGTDVVLVDGDGRLAYVAGFFGEPTPLG